MLTILKRSSIFIIPYWALMALFYLILWFCPKNNVLIGMLGVSGYNLLLFFSPIWLVGAIWIAGYRRKREFIKPAILCTLLVLCIDVTFFLLHILLFGY